MQKARGEPKVRLVELECGGNVRDVENDVAEVRGSVKDWAEKSKA